ncbi:MAG TPA: GNAT family N-acetyltransferase [Acidimicrobiales bacterium]|nr:GNAT family N-acetyltransferase [Acidimicrobiales bacterium]
MYASSRADEFAAMGWSTAELTAFLRQQSDLQSRSYAMQFPAAESSVIVRDGEPIGRLYVDRTATELRVLDIALLPEYRGCGIGGAIISTLLAEAAAENVPVRLHVARGNPARNLYLRLGFVDVEPGPMHDLLEWRVTRRQG